VGIAGKGRGIVPSGSGVGLGVGESIGAGVCDGTVSGVRTGDACTAGVGSGTLVDTGKLTVWLSECGYESNRRTKRADWL
jgi:hypothetical protein